MTFNSYFLTTTLQTSQHQLGLLIPVVLHIVSLSINITIFEDCGACLITIEIMDARGDLGDGIWKVYRARYK
jgi:hypothetical protein